MNNYLLKIPIFIEDSAKAKADSLFRGIEKKMYHFFAETATENGYTDREKQYDMAEEVLDTIKENGELLVEAGVGIGKTFAYLVPALLYSHVTQKPIAIATSTIALQEQLKGDVEEVARMLGTPCCSRPSGRLVFPCIPHSYKCAFSGRIYPLVVQYF